MKRIPGILALAALAATSGIAQLTRGYISGTVQDGTGAIVRGVAVRVINLATNVKAETTTNDDGVYRFVAVEPGAYRVEFSKAGFEERQYAPVEVSTAQEAVVNETLRPATVSSSVTVETPAGVELAKASANVDLDLGGDTAEKMPLRDATYLARLAPLAVRSGPGVMSTTGQSKTRNNFTVDGLDHSGTGPGALVAANRLLPESVGELHVQALPYSAEFGRSGAQISAITRSGSNQWHAEAWDYFNSHFLNSRSLPDKTAGIEADRYVEHDAGGSLGGPVIKNRTFFFGLVNTDRQRTGPSTRSAMPINIPTPDGFSALSKIPLGTGQTPESRQAALSALDFLKDIYPQIKSFQPATPANINGVVVPMGGARVPLFAPETWWDWRGRMDHKLSTKDTLSFTTQGSSDISPIGPASNLRFGSLFAETRNLFTDSFALSHTRAQSSSWVNEARFGFTSYRQRSDATDSRSFAAIGPPAQPDFAIGRAAGGGGQLEDRFYQFQDVTSYLKGRHALKAGIDLTIHNHYDPGVNNSRGTWIFTNLAAFLNSQPMSYTQISGNQAIDIPLFNQAYFAQDEFRILRTLTLSIGLRYELWNTPYGFFGATLPEVLAAGVPGPVQQDRNNLAPRGSLAWSPSAKAGLSGRLLGDGRTVFRGGYGVAYDVWFYGGPIGTTNYPRAQTFQIDSPANLFPQIIVKPPKGFDPLYPFVNAAPDGQLPTLHFYSFSIQRQLARGVIAEIGYSGNRGYHLESFSEHNPAILTQAQANAVIAARNGNAIPAAQQRRLNPAWGPRTVVESGGVSHYNALFTRFDKRLSHGLAVAANYVYSSALASAQGVDSAGPQKFFDNGRETGRTLFDRPHRGTVQYSYTLAARERSWRALLGGWGVTGYTEWQSGAPFTVTTGVDSTGIGPTAFPASPRPDYNPAGILLLDPVTHDLRSFSTPINGTGVFTTALDSAGRPLPSSMPFGGNLGRYTFRVPHISLWSVAASKGFPVTERLRAEFRADAENLFNHRNFGVPISAMNNARFGANTGDAGIRTIRLSLKLRY